MDAVNPTMHKNQDTIEPLLDSLEAAEGMDREHVARGILDHDSSVIRRLADAWSLRFQSPDDLVFAWIVVGVFAILVAYPIGSSLLADPRTGNQPAGWALIAAALGLAGACALYHRRRMARFRWTRRNAVLAAETLLFADSSRHAPWLLGSLYGFRDRRKRETVMVTPVADALIRSLAQSEDFDFRALDDTQKAYVRLHLSRVRDQMWREPLVLLLLQGIRRCDAAEYLKDVKHLARATRSDEVKQAATACAESLSAFLAKQKEQSLLLRATESTEDHQTLVRPAGPATELDQSLLRSAGGDSPS